MPSSRHKCIVLRKILSRSQKIFQNDSSKRLVFHRLTLLRSYFLIRPNFLISVEISRCSIAGDLEFRALRSIHEIYMSNELNSKFVDSRIAFKFVSFFIRCETVLRSIFNFSTEIENDFFRLVLIRYNNERADDNLLLFRLAV